MKPGKQRTTGHMVELRPCPGKNWHDKHWNSEKREFIDDGLVKFFYCTDCNQYAWGWEAICPKNRVLQKVYEWVAI